MKKVYITLSAIVGITLVLWVAYTMLTETIKLRANINDVAIAEIHTAGSDGIYTKDKSKIKDIIDYSNSIRYLKKDEAKMFNSASDAYIALYNSDNKIIDRIEYFGNVAVYKNSTYMITPLTYRGLENLCTKLNKK